MTSRSSKNNLPKIDTSLPEFLECRIVSRLEASSSLQVNAINLSDSEKSTDALAVATAGTSPLEFPGAVTTAVDTAVPAVTTQLAYTHINTSPGRSNGPCSFFKIIPLFNMFGSP